MWCSGLLVLLGIVDESEVRARQWTTAGQSKSLAQSSPVLYEADSMPQGRDRDKSREEERQRRWDSSELSSSNHEFPDHFGAT